MLHGPCYPGLETIVCVYAFEEFGTVRTLLAKHRGIHPRKRRSLELAANLRFSLKVQMYTQPLPQKLHQLDEDGHVALHDISCLWVWIKKKLSTMFSGEVLDRHQKLWEDGLFGNDSNTFPGAIFWASLAKG